MQWCFLDLSYYEAPAGQQGTTHTKKRKQTNTHSTSWLLLRVQNSHMLGHTNMPPPSPPPVPSYLIRRDKIAQVLWFLQGKICPSAFGAQMRGHNKCQHEYSHCARVQGCVRRALVAKCLGWLHRMVVFRPAYVKQCAADTMTRRGKYDHSTLTRKTHTAMPGIDRQRQNLKISIPNLALVRCFVTIARVLVW